MIDANQRWDVQEAIDRVSALAEFRPLWVKLNTNVFKRGLTLVLKQIEEPTKDDDVLGHAKIAKALKPTGIR